MPFQQVLPKASPQGLFCAAICNRRLISSLAIDLLERLLKFDPAERLSAAEALQHPYFSTAVAPSPSFGMNIGAPNMNVMPVNNMGAMPPPPPPSFGAYGNPHGHHPQQQYSHPQQQQHPQHQQSWSHSAANVGVGMGAPVGGAPQQPQQVAPPPQQAQQRAGPGAGGYPQGMRPPAPGQPQQAQPGMQAYGQQNMVPGYGHPMGGYGHGQ